MLDRAFRDVLRSFSTLFLLIALVTLPLHLLYAFSFRNVIATRDIHAQIRELPDDRSVLGVGQQQLTNASVAYWVLVGLELALLPLAVKASRHVVEVEERGGVATVPDAWRHAMERNGPRIFASTSAPSVAIATIAAFVLGALLENTLLVASELGDAQRNWAVIGTVQGAARAFAAPFLLVTIAKARVAKERPLVTPKLY